MSAQVCFLFYFIYFSHSTFFFFWHITSSTSSTTTMTSIFATIFAISTQRIQWQPNRPLAPLTLTRRLPQKWHWQQQQLKKYCVLSPRYLNDGLYHCLDLRYIFFLFSFLSTNTFFSSGFIIDLLRKNTGDWRKRQRRLEEGRGLRCICVLSPWVWT